MTSNRHVYLVALFKMLWPLDTMKDGIPIADGDRNIVVHRTVLLALADTLVYQLGGFKVAVGFSLRKCHECMATYSDIQTKV